MPPAPKLGVALPADAVFLHFASEGFEGRLTWSTAQAPAALARGARQEGSRTVHPRPVPPGDREDEGELRGGDGVDRPRRERHALGRADGQGDGHGGEDDGRHGEEPGRLAPEQQAAALASATGQSLLEAGLAEVYTDAELFGDPKLFVVKGTDGVEVAVAVYEDRALRRTGITVHRPRGFGG